MRFPSPPFTQEQFDAWYNYHLARVDNKEFYFVDLNDGVMVYAAGAHLANAHPEKKEAIVEKLSEAVDGAVKERGMYMGISWLAIQVGLETQAGVDAMNTVVRSL